MAEKTEPYSSKSPQDQLTSWTGRSVAFGWLKEIRQGWRRGMGSFVVKEKGKGNPAAQRSLPNYAVFWKTRGKKR